MSRSKIICYDLCASGRNYDDLYKYIKSYAIWAHVTESTWFISTDKTCVDIKNDLKRIVDSNDRIFVAELTGTAAGYNILCNSEYLTENL